MKRQFTHLVLAAGLSAILGSLTASAQSQSEIAKIPFAFQANGTTLSAGTYTLDQYSSASNIFRVHDARGGGIFVGTHSPSLSKVNNPHLTFTCHGEDCALSAILMPDGKGYEVSIAAQDRDLSRKMGLTASIRTVRLSNR